MRNLLTVQIESYLGAVFISLFALFFIALIFIVMKNFDSELSVMQSENLEVKISPR
ncbi:MAG: hypothetical protein HYX22_01725 [Candidatus Yanofskybacteria bacterium]|nr:hypothetical protein [Candidatus Yanofskybacteria bacterium]